MTEDKNYKVYKHTNLLNKKVYIGITCQDVNRRWNNGKGYNNNPHFLFAIQKYGWNNFEHVVLFDKLTKEQAEEKESELIQYYNSTNPEYGYNIKNGGFHPGSMPDSIKEKIGKSNLGKKRTNEAKEKMRKKALQMTDEHKRKMSEARIGVKPWNTGVVFSEEEKDKIKGNTYIPVRCIELQKIFKSISYASRELDIPAGNITKVCRGERHTAGGYHWEYV